MESKFAGEEVTKRCADDSFEVAELKAPTARNVKAQGIALGFGTENELISPNGRNDAAKEAIITRLQRSRKSHWG